MAGGIARSSDIGCCGAGRTKFAFHDHQPVTCPSQVLAWSLQLEYPVPLLILALLISAAMLALVLAKLEK